MNLKERLKILKSIKADENFKAVLRMKMLEKIGGGILMPQSRPVSMWQAIFMKKAALMPIVLIIAILGMGIGGAYASQSSLPGDILYPVKMATEKTQLVLTRDEVKKSQLYMKFSLRRLEEAKKLIENGKAEPALLESAISDYQKKVSEVDSILKSAPSDSEKFIKMSEYLKNTTPQNEVIIDDIEEKIKGRNGEMKIFRESLKNAKEKIKETKKEKRELEKTDKDKNKEDSPIFNDKESGSNFGNNIKEEMRLKNKRDDDNKISD